MSILGKTPNPAVVIREGHMVETISIEDAIYDLETIRIAAETYEQVSSGPFDGAFESLNAWHDDNSLTAETIGTYLDQLRDTVAKLDLDTTGLDDLVSFAEQSPAEAASAIEHLYQGDDSLAERIDQLRDVRSVGTTAVSCLLAAYDRAAFAPYPETAFTSLTDFACDYNEPTLEDYSVPEKYALYNTTIDRLGDALDGMTRSFDRGERMADLIATVINDPQHRYTAVLQRLVAFSTELDALDEDTDHHLETIAELPRPVLERQADHYRDSIKINDIRFRVLDRILDGQDVTTDDLESIKEEVNAEYDKNITRNWRNFTILAGLRYDLHKTRFRIFLDELTDYLITELDSDGLEAHVVDYTGMANFPTKNPWFALYPVDSPGFRQCCQLYLGVYPDHVQYGLVTGADVEDEVRETTELESPTIDAVIDRFQQDFDRFEQLNSELDWYSDDEDDEEEEEPREQSGFREYARQLERTGQLIFYGPPGTSKTYSAREFADWWLYDDDASLSRDDRLHFVMLR